jgi:thiol:disulfide interchange protein DsbC
MLKLIPALLAALLLAAPAVANEVIQKAVQAQFGTAPEKITKTDYLGLYEVFIDGQIIYTDEKASAFIVGTLYDAKNMQNVTGKRLFSMLPLDLAVKQVRGNGKATLVSFEDPNCGYCKRLAKDMQKMKDVTIYTFLYPILSDDSAEKSKAIWCSSDRAKAWNDWMIDNKSPTTKKDCSAPVEKFVELGQRFQVSGTPTMLFTDGSRIPGAAPVAQIEQKLAAIAKKSGGQ